MVEVDDDAQLQLTISPRNREAITCLILGKLYARNARTENREMTLPCDETKTAGRTWYVIHRDDSSNAV